MEKINIAELLKDCPKGMELDCTIFNSVTFGGIDSGSSYPIEIKIGDKNTVTESLTEFGEWNTNENSKCVIFPKGKTTWEGFVPPCQFKNGDVIYNQCIQAVAIFYKQTDDSTISHCFQNKWKELELYHHHCKLLSGWRLAPEEKKEELFQAIKKNGYEWNEKTKTLEKLMVKPLFKAGDKIIKKNDIYAHIQIAYVDNGFYYFNTESSVGMLPISDQDSYELVLDKFDTTTLVPFESKMLVRSADGDFWKPAVYGFFSYKGMYVVGGIFWTQYIPYEGNEHLLGTSNDCSEFYKNWK